MQKETTTYSLPAGNRSIAINTRLAKEHIRHLPAIIQLWLIRSGVIGTPIPSAIRLREKGQLRLKPGDKWISFTAEENIALGEPAYKWLARINVSPFVHLSVCDRFEHGNAGTTVKFFSLIPLLTKNGNKKIDEAAWLRFLGELCWIPAFACHPMVSWEQVRPLCARAVISCDHIAVSGLFDFDANGDFLQFTAWRYYKSDQAAVPERWVVKATAYNVFSGYRLPSSFSVNWELKEGDFNWMNFSVTSLEYLPQTVSQKLIRKS